MTDNIKEVGYAITKGSVGSIPLAGGVLSELFGIAFADPVTKRREQTLLEMDERLKKLENEGLDIQELARNEKFLTIAMQAYNIALKTHQLIKRKALMNAISNTPKLSIDENKMQMFLTYIDEFNEWHLKIFSFLNNPSSYFDEDRKPSLYMAGKSSILTLAFPKLESDQNFYDRIVKDLYNKGIINVESLHTTISEQGLWESSTTEFGGEFFQFISDIE